MGGVRTEDVEEIKEEPAAEAPVIEDNLKPQEEPVKPELVKAEPVKAEPAETGKKNPFGIIAGLLSAGIVGVIIAIVFVIMKYYV